MSDLAGCNRKFSELWKCASLRNLLNVTLPTLPSVPPGPTNSNQQVFCQPCVPILFANGASARASLAASRFTRCRFCDVR